MLHSLTILPQASQIFSSFTCFYAFHNLAPFQSNFSAREVESSRLFQQISKLFSSTHPPPSPQVRICFLHCQTIFQWLSLYLTDDAIAKLFVMQSLVKWLNIQLHRAKQQRHQLNFLTVHGQNYWNFSPSIEYIHRTLPGHYTLSQKQFLGSKHFKILHENVRDIALKMCRL